MQSDNNLDNSVKQYNIFKVLLQYNRIPNNPMSNKTVQEQFAEYLTLNKELAGYRTKTRDLKRKVDELEKTIKEYMKSHDMDSISLQEGQIVLYSKKIPQTFKKEVITEKLTETLKDAQKAEELAQSILQNKAFVIEDKVKAVIKKK